MSDGVGISMLILEGKGSPFFYGVGGTEEKGVVGRYWVAMCKELIISSLQPFLGGGSKIFWTE